MGKEENKELFSEDAEIQKILNSIMDSFANGLVDKATIKQGKVKVYLSINFKGVIKVERVKTLKEARTF